MFLSAIGGYGDSGISGILYAAIFCSKNRFKLIIEGFSDFRSSIEALPVVVPVESCFWDYKPPKGLYAAIICL